MGCNSGSVQSAADKTVAAKEQIDKLNAMINGQVDGFKSKFYTEINEHLAAANVKDARELEFNFDVKTEYTSEFSLDKIAKVVTSALQALSKAKDPTTPNAATSPEAIAAYTDVVNSVAEAAKSSSDSASSLSFSMNHLGPGLFAFLYAFSSNIKDEGLFGSEAVTSTAILYRFMQSIDDVKQGAAFSAAILDKDSYLKMKAVQAALVDDLSNGKIDIDEWTKRDAQLSKAVQTIKDRLDRDGFPTSQLKAVHAHLSMQAAHPSVVSVTAQKAVQRLHGAGHKDSAAISLTEKRLQAGYFES